MHKPVKKVLIVLLCLVLVAGLVVGILSAVGKKSKPVNVYSLADFAYQSDDTDLLELYGTVAMQNIQTVRLSDTQTVIKVYVTQGQSVKVGDPVIAFDTTLSELAVQRQQLKVQQGELNLQNAQTELRRINSMKPYVPRPEPKPTEPTEPTEPDPIYPEELPWKLGGEGTQESPYRYLWSDSLRCDDETVAKLTGDREETWISFELRENDALNGTLLSYWGVVFYRDKSDAEQETLSFAFFTPEAPEEPDEPDTPNDPQDDYVDDSSGYTAAEIAQMRKEKEQEIRDLDLDLRMQKVELSRMQKELSDGVVKATTDGTVMSVLDEETARTEDKPLVTISGGGGYTVESAVSELMLDTISVGQELQVTSYESWTDYTGTIIAISDSPVQDSSNFNSGNTNVSYYPITVSIDASAELTENEFMSIKLPRAGSQGGFLLSNYFVIQENLHSYVYRDNGGVLEKVEIQVGTSQYDMIRVLSGITMDDKLAFPYSASCKEGAKTVEASSESLYGY